MEGYVFGFRPFLIIIGNDVNSLTSAIRGHLPTTFRKCWIIIIGTQTKKHKFHLSLGGLNWTFSDWFVDHLSGPGQHYLTSHYPGDHYPDHTRAPRSLSQIIVTRDDRDHNDTRVNIAETMTLCHHETWDRRQSPFIQYLALLSSIVNSIYWYLKSDSFMLWDPCFLSHDPKHSFSALWLKESLLRAQ